MKKKKEIKWTHVEEKRMKNERNKTKKGKKRNERKKWINEDEKGKKNERNMMKTEEEKINEQMKKTMKK